MLDTNGMTAADDQDLARYVADLRDRGEPAVLTINGTGRLVIDDPATYAKLLELVDRVETLAGIREAMAEFERGEGRPAAEVFEEIRRKYDIPRDV
jgi:PHD/YefM family antitoxin component YafN of YafNO toxin-antitoxin module